MRMTLAEKMEQADILGIKIPGELLEKENVVGVYGFFAVKEKEEYCFYIGKTTSMTNRILNEHIHYYLNRDYAMLVAGKIKEYLNAGYKIDIRILDRIDYHDKTFSKAAHRLALAELNEKANPPAMLGRME